MKRNREKVWEENLLPIETIEAVVNGDANACKNVLKAFEGYIAKVCTRQVFDENNQSFDKVDKAMRDYVEQKLLYALVFKYRMLPQS